MEQQTIKKIDINDLQPGMYLEDVFNDQGVFLLSANTQVVSFEQIQKLKSRGIRKVHINLSKGKRLDATADVHTAAARRPRLSPQEETEYYQELPRAREVRRQTWEAAREALNAVKKGRSFDIGKVERAAEAIVESILRNDDALVSLCQIKGYDEYTYVHSVNVGVLVTSLAHSMGYEGERLLAAGMGGILHDIGKMRIPESILNKPGKYAAWEFEVMKKHPLHGIDIVEDRIDLPGLARTIIVQHHERFNGSGYPYGLKDEQIDEAGVIAAVADVYDALTSDRVYRPAWTPQKAIATIFQGCDEQYSRRVAELFAKHIGIYPVGSFVRLVSGEMGVVVRSEAGKLLTPTVLVLFDHRGSRLAEPVEYDLMKKQSGEDGDKYKIEVSLNPKAYRVEVNKYIDKSAAAG